MPSSSKPKKIISAFDPRLSWGAKREKNKQMREKEAAKPRVVEQVPTSLFFAHNEALGPPYYVIIDTNFFNMCVKNKIELFDGLMNCFYAKCIPVVLDAVMAELETLGPRYRIALRMAKDERCVRMPDYLEKGHYADDAIVQMCKMHRCFLVATQDKDLRRRLRQIPGVPIVMVKNRKITVERMPEAFGAARV